MPTIPFWLKGLVKDSMETGRSKGLKTAYSCASSYCTLWLDTLYVARGLKRSCYIKIGGNISSHVNVVTHNIICKDKKPNISKFWYESTSFVWRHFDNNRNYFNSNCKNTISIWHSMFYRLLCLPAIILSFFFAVQDDFATITYTVFTFQCLCLDAGRLKNLNK